jgi:ATP-dependent DNA helicase RecQ
MPTGGGKSVCYQLPGLLLNGVTVVISPLISLMKDQIHALSQNGIPAAYINGTLSETQIDKVLSNAKAGKYKLIYAAPERLESGKFCDFCNSAPIPFVAVDEAHCASQWGQDFRPSYALIQRFIAGLQKRPVVAAFTATATPKVQEDVIRILGLQNPKTVRNSFDRKNLSFEVLKPKKKYETLVKLLKERAGQYGVVYCATRKTVEEVCDRLKSDGFRAAKYHAGLTDAQRHGAQDDFIYDRVEIMAATNAFGMGIDKSNISFVVHYNMPQDIESYYQEAGRAGRDGSKADCILLFGGQDVRTNLFLIENTQDRSYESDAQRDELLAKARERLRLMERYCHTGSCLRGFILGYCGESGEARCGNCGNCQSETEDADITVLSQKILSCVARAGERFGRNMIVNVLRGRKSERVLRFGLDKISTFGICKESEEEIKEAFEYLTENGYLYVTNDAFPLVKLGEKASEILKDRAAVLMRRKKKQTPAETDHGTGGARFRNAAHYDAELFLRLKSVRTSVAQRQGVPAYVVFHDAALQEMAAYKPATLEAFACVSGVGARKLEAYGKEFVACIQEYLDEGK